MSLAEFSFKTMVYDVLLSVLAVEQISNVFSLTDDRVLTGQKLFPEH